MRIACFATFDELTSYADDWDRLAAGVPFRSWTWLSCWWRHYGSQSRGESARRRLAVLCAFDDSDRPVGIAPWYLECSALHGRVLRALGSDEVCSDYLGVLCQPQMGDAVTESLADYLVEQAHSLRSDALRWDLLDWSGIDAEDREVAALERSLSQAGWGTYRRPSANCWRLKLPTVWDEYVAGLGKNFRRDVRRLERDFLQSKRAVLHVVDRLQDLPRAMEILVQLHQRRQRTRGEPGCFASPRFTAFYHEVVPELLRRGQVQFYWLELDGKPAAAEYQLVGDGILYAYQAGVDPDAMEHQPGKLLNVAILQCAIARGYREFDFLRGDEPYKARFGAESRRSVVIRIVPQHAVAQLRHGLWLAGKNLKQWAKRGLKRAKVNATKEPPKSLTSDP
jgi:CelD/BcsL family acetyltransferase involved in cellulose biosynthesis